MKLGNELKEIIERGRGFDPVRFQREHDKVFLGFKRVDDGYLIALKQPYSGMQGRTIVVLPAKKGVMVDFLNSIKVRTPIPEGLQIDHITLSGPATIVFWKDGSKTIVKAQNGEDIDYEKGIALCFMKKVNGNNGNYNNIFREYIVSEDKEKDAKAQPFEADEDDVGFGPISLPEAEK